ncbi:MAG: DUF2845 domain-containing protein [Methylovulum sp.]|nr:DUF2845 domain-containing protein [Methylovulum sp.]
MKLLILLFLSLCLCFADAAYALRCGHELVDLGDYKADVIDKCGEPESIETHIERRGGSDFASRSRYYGNGKYPRASGNYGQQQYVEIEVVVEEWVYDFGRRKFQQYLRFENGRLKEIKRLDRGG